MKSLVAEVLETIENVTYPVTVKSVREPYSKLAPAYPMVIVDEVNNTTLLALKGEERLSSVVYQVEVFSKDMLVGSTITSGVDVCKSIGKLIDSELNTIYGMTRTSAVSTPDINDATVSRYILRYDGILDVKTDYMYR